jgi:threonine 3-dehydrogenase
MRVPKFLGQGRIGWTEKPIPRAGPGQLVIQVKANALCGTDRRYFNGGAEITPGHEAAGIVSEAGDHTHTPVGTRGVVYLMGFCGSCRNCLAGYSNLCTNKRSKLGSTDDGAYGPSIVIPENTFFPVDAEIALSEATLLLDIMGTGGHALKRARSARSDPGSILVTGAGPIGLGVLMMARLTLEESFPVFVADFVPYRLGWVEKLGGIPIPLREQPLREGLLDHGMKEVDLVIEASGNSEALRSGISALGTRGVLVCVGHGSRAELDGSNDLIKPERSVIGSEYFHFDELPGNLALFRAHRDYLVQIITHRFAVADLQQAFELFFEGNTGKVIVEP